MNNSRRLIFGLILGCLAAPGTAAQLVGGAGGTLKIIVTSGVYDLDGPLAWGPKYDLSGSTGILRFSSKVWSGVPRPYAPFGNFSTYVMNSIAFGITVQGLGVVGAGGSSSSYEPDPGQVYNKATFSGNAATGQFYSLNSVNSGYGAHSQLSYQANGKTGSGVTSQYWEDFAEPLISFSFLVTDGTTYNAVPEPSAWILMVGGLALVGTTMRRRRRGFPNGLNFR